MVEPRLIIPGLRTTGRSLAGVGLTGVGFGRAFSTAGLGSWTDEVNVFSVFPFLIKVYTFSFAVLEGSVRMAFSLRMRRFPEGGGVGERPFREPG